MLPVERRSLKNLHQLSQAASVFVFAFGGLIFLGWLIESAAIKTFFPGISPTTSFGFALTGGAAALLMMGRARTLARVCAALAIVIGVLKLSEILLGIDTGIDHLILITSLARNPSCLRRIPPSTLYW